MLGWELPPHNSGGLGVACFYMAKALAEKGADIDYRNQTTNLQIIEYALLAGFYEIVFYLYPAINDKEFKTPEEY